MNEINSFLISRDKKDFVDRAGVIIDTLAPLSDAHKEIVLEIVRVVFPKLKGTQGLKKNNEEDISLKPDKDLKISDGPKHSGY